MICFNRRLVPKAIFLLLTAATPLLYAQQSSLAQQPDQKATVADRASQTPNSDAIDDFVRKQMEQRHIPGVSLAIVQQGKMVKATGYGMANVELSVPATQDTVYQLASVTKTFTATAIMMLVEEGKLNLDDKIGKHLPNLPTAWEDVTVRQLLNHTSGIKSYTSIPDFFKSARKDFAQQEIIDLVASAPLEFAPGEKWRYNNTGYFLLGMLIEKTTGKKYGDFLSERIFKPLDMAQTRVNDLHAVIPNRAQGYAWDGKSLRNGDYVSPTQPFSAGMLVSTVSDLVKWDAALYSEKLLKKSTLESMWTPTTLAKDEQADYGFGWQTKPQNGHRQLAHGGGIPGFSTQISRFVNDQLTVIVLTNSGSGNAGAIASGVAALVEPALAKQAEKPIADTDEKTTERLKGVLTQAMKGEADPEMFTAQAKQNLVPRITEQGKAMFGPLGALKTFELLERKPADSKVTLRYRATFENQARSTTFVLDEAGKIAGVMVEE
jgi:D-alanyl-D-alanine carboxypeptidase